MIVSDISCIAALWLILSRSFQVETPLLLRFIVKGLGKTPHVWAGKSTAFPIDLLNLLKRLGSRWRFPTIWAWHLDMLLGTILPDPVALWLQNNLYIVIPFPLKITLLWVIPTLTHYSDLVSDLPFRSIYCIYIFWNSIWHSFWHILWHSFWHLFWHLFWQSIWRSFWHIFWHYVWHCIWHSLWLAFGSRHAPQHPALAIWCLGPGVTHCIRRRGRRRTRKRPSPGRSKNTTQSKPNKIGGYLGLRMSWNQGGALHLDLLNKNIKYIGRFTYICVCVQ